MTIDYDQLRELADECTTGQWQSHDYEPDPYCYPGATRFVIAADWDRVEIAESQAGPLTKSSDYARKASDFALMALAPDMARELLRLRRELRDLRDLMYTNAGYLRKDGHAIAADHAENHAYRLARILERRQTMTNLDRAAALLIPNRTWCEKHHKGEAGDPCGFCEYNAQTGAERLADAGLLAPDLPEPDECPQDIHTPGWRIDQDKYAAVLAGQVHISDYFGWGNSYPPAVIRTMAYKLLAAADYAEKHPARFRKEGQQ
ncbi:hypothetical protein [Corynebacterium riegelii]|uniref:hypothetical protein n=1 Tax=Corynebacterium riegelii TaxID=156976 RepID=UPI00288B8CC1|nr:hypothetical protein [Corynebacterium riegelii]